MGEYPALSDFEVGMILSQISTITTSPPRVVHLALELLDLLTS